MKIDLFPSRKREVTHVYFSEQQKVRMKRISGLLSEDERKCDKPGNSESFSSLEHRLFVLQNRLSDESLDWPLRKLGPLFLTLTP